MTLEQLSIVATLDLDMVMVGFAVLLMLVVLFFYLFLRRTLVGFREGLEEGRR